MDDQSTAQEIPEEQTSTPGDGMAANSPIAVPAQDEIPLDTQSPASVPAQSQVVAPSPDQAAPTKSDTAVSVPSQDGLDTHTFVNGLPIPPTAQQLNDHDLRLATDLATKAIHPKTYNDLYAEKSTVGKAMTLFGLLLGGAGSGLTGQPNALLQMMNKQIDNDLEAQKASKAGANTWLSTAYAHQLQQSEAALNAAKLAQVPLTTQQLKLQNQSTSLDNNIKAQTAAKNGMMLGMLQNYQDAADKLAPSAQPAAQNLINNTIKPAVVQQIQQNNQQTADQLNARFKINQDRLRLLGEGELAGSNEARNVPGVGQAAVPVTSEDRNQILAAQNFTNKINKYKDFVKNTSTLDKLNPAQINQGKVIAAELQTAFRQATNGGVYKEGEKNYIDSIIPSDPTKFGSSFRVMPQIDAIQQDANERFGTLLKSKGLPVPNTANQESQTSKASGSPKEGMIIVNPKTGARLQMTRGKWVPVGSGK